jgi:hypothetical protein
MNLRVSLVLWLSFSACVDIDDPETLGATDQGLVLTRPIGIAVPPPQAEASCDQLAAHVWGAGFSPGQSLAVQFRGDNGVLLATGYPVTNGLGWFEMQYWWLVATTALTVDVFDFGSGSWTHVPTVTCL